jgi:hypothetical protein
MYLAHHSKLAAAGGAALLFMAVTIAPHAAHADPSPFDGGDGTSAGTAFQISTCTQLQDMEDYLTSYFILTEDIDCSATSGWNEGAGFAPVGNVSTPFTGHLDGNEHTVSGLYIHPSAGYAGLFGDLGDGATVTDLGLEDVDVSSPEDMVGGIVGFSDGDISGSSVTGAVENTGSFSNVGGLAGFVAGGTVTDSYSRATVTGYDAVGGLVGHNYGFGTITRSYAAGPVTATGENVGGLADNAGTVTDSFFDTEVTGQSGGGGTGTTTAAMKLSSTFTDAGWDFTDTWGIVGPSVNDGYPVLLWQEVTAPPGDTTAPGIVGDVIVSGITQTGATISWTTDEAADGQVRFGTTTSYSLDTEFDTLQTSHSATLTGLTAGTTYHFSLRNTDGSDNTSDSDDTSFATLDPVEEEHHSSHRSGGSVSSQVANLTAMGNTAAADALKAQWPQLFGPDTAPGTPVSASPSQTLGVRDLELGMTGDDVLALQKLLNANGTPVAASGPGSAGDETTYFGALTKAALAKYQAAHGIAPAAGYFGPLTRAQMKAAGLAGLWW